MRYYNLAITTAKGAAFKSWTTHPNGVSNPPDPGALQIDFDLVVTTYDTPVGASTITLSGPALQDLGQPQNFAGLTLTLSAGMGVGLPLANPQQSGVILVGTIYQCFGNWIGTDMALTFVVLPSNYTAETPGNLVLIWPANTPLAQPLANCLSVAYPGVKQNMLISGNVVAPNDETHAAGTLESLSAYLTPLTQSIVGGDYPGITISIQRGQLYIQDGTQPPATQPLTFTDFVGQPTWLDPALLQVTTVMRADLIIGSVVKMPQNIQDQPGIVTTTFESLPSSANQRTLFQGNFTVSSIRHNGNSRSPDGRDWVSMFNCLVA